MPSKLYLYPHAALVSFGYLTVLVNGSLWSTLSTSGTLLSPQLFTGARSNFKAKCHKQDCFLGTRDPYLYHLKKLLPLSGHLTVGIETLPGMNINGNVFKYSNYCQLLCSSFPLIHYLSAYNDFDISELPSYERANSKRAYIIGRLEAFNEIFHIEVPNPGET